jgi:hypothetical protein
MAILATTPLNTGTITNLYTAVHPTMGKGWVIETILCYKDKDPQPAHKASIRFFPKDIMKGALYSGGLTHGDGTNVMGYEELWQLEDLEPFSPTKAKEYINVNDFSEFMDWDWNTDATVEVNYSPIDFTLWRLHVKVHHVETRGRRYVEKRTEFTHTSPWINAPSQEAAEPLLRKEFKDSFFAKWQGCTLFMKSTPKRTTHGS